MLHKHFLGCLPCAVITHVLLSLSSGGQGCRTLQSGPAHGSVPSCSPDLCAVQPDLISEWEDASENRNAEPEAQHRELCVPDALAVPGSQSPAYQLEQCKSEVERMRLFTYRDRYCAGSASRKRSFPWKDCQKGEFTGSKNIQERKKKPKRVSNT